MFKNILSSQKSIFLLLAIAATLVISWPLLNFQPLLSQGDHGRDLYTFEQVLNGKIVYKDVWWVYGPLMPYYYGLCYLLFGFKISSILLGKFFLTLLSGVFFYLASSVVMPFAWAFLATCFFVRSQQEFFFTFNHIGAIVLTLAAFWLLLKYLYKNDLRFSLGALALCFLVGLVKINFGLTALVATLLSFTLIHFTQSYDLKKLLSPRNTIVYIAGLVLIPSLWILTYACLLGSLPIYEIRQCMPYFGDDQPHHRTPFETIPYFLTQHWLTLYHHWLNLTQIVGSILQHPANLFAPMALLMLTLVVLNFLTHPIIHGSMMAGLIFSFSKKFDDRRRLFWLTQAILWIFFILNFHEFIVSGVWYRTFWSQPFHLFFSFFMIATAMSFAPKWLRYIVGAIWIAFFTILSSIGLITIKNTNAPEKLLTMPRGQIYVGNEPGWVNTVNTVTSYINQNLKKDELFFALPYDCLYYYLTGRPSPTRQLIFFDHIKIPAQQEISVIQDLEKHKVNYVVMSNRISSSEQGLGVFGKTYCPIISQYIMQNFTPLFRYGGNWETEPGWCNNHGVIILKRKGLTNSIS